MLGNLEFYLLTFRAFFFHIYSNSQRLATVLTSLRQNTAVCLGELCLFLPETPVPLPHFFTRFSVFFRLLDTTILEGQSVRHSNVGSCSEMCYFTLLYPFSFPPITVLLFFNEPFLSHSLPLIEME